MALGVNCDISLDQAVFPSSDGPVPTPGMYRVVALMCVHYNAVTPVVHTAPLYTGVRCPQHAVSHPHILKTVLYTRTAFSYLLILDGHPVFGVGHGGHSVQCPVGHPIPGQASPLTRLLNTNNPRYIFHPSLLLLAKLGPS